MRILVALVALLALASSASAWELNEELQYTLTKTGYQQAGSELIRNQLEGATSGAYFSNPNSLNGKNEGQVTNTLKDLTVDREINVPYVMDLDEADFYATLVQGGSASLATKSIDGVDNSVAELVGDANAYQQVVVGGGFDEVNAAFNSQALVGKFDSASNNAWVVSETSDDTSASVSSEDFGAGEFITAYMGESVSAGIEQGWSGSGWDDPTYSGGISMTAGFTGGCNPNCANPIISTVTGSVATSLFPSNQALLTMNEPAGTNWGIGDNAYWGLGDGTNDVDTNGIVNPIYTNPATEFLN